MLDTGWASVVMGNSSFGMTAAIAEAVDYVTTGVGMFIYDTHGDESVSIVIAIDLRDDS